MILKNLIPKLAISAAGRKKESIFSQNDFGKEIKLVMQGCSTSILNSVLIAVHKESNRV